MIETGSPGWLRDLLPYIVDLVYRAGSAILELSDKGDHVVTTKVGGSLQAEADRLSHAIIVNGLIRLSQDWPIVSEEGAEFPFAERESWRYFWLVDPLDGTREFIRKIDEFTVNVALIEGDSPILGVVYAPARGTLYYAAKGEGAWKSNGDDGPIQIAVSKSCSEAARVLVSRSHSGTERMLTHLSGLTQPCDVIAMGSSLKFCLVADGSADLYPRTGRTMEWDTAAAQCILEEAGGRVIDSNGRSLRYNKPVLSNDGFLAQGHPATSTDLSVFIGTT